MWSGTASCSGWYRICSWRRRLWYAVGVLVIHVPPACGQQKSGRKRKQTVVVDGKKQTVFRWKQQRAR